MHQELTPRGREKLTAALREARLNGRFFSAQRCGSSIIVDCWFGCRPLPLLELDVRESVSAMANKLATSFARYQGSR